MCAINKERPRVHISEALCDQRVSLDKFAADHRQELKVTISSRQSIPQNLSSAGETQSKPVNKYLALHGCNQKHERKWIQGNGRSGEVAIC